MHIPLIKFFGIRSTQRASQRKLERSGEYFGKQHYWWEDHKTESQLPLSELFDLWIQYSASRYESDPIIEGITILEGSDDGISHLQLFSFVFSTVQCLIF
jgi:hypothetical protein